MARANAPYGADATTPMLPVETTMAHVADDAHERERESESEETTCCGCCWFFGRRANASTSRGDDARASTAREGAREAAVARAAAFERSAIGRAARKATTDARRATTEARRARDDARDDDVARDWAR